MKTLRPVVGLVMAAIIAIGACSSGAGPSDDPATTVRSAYSAAQSDGIEAMLQYACEAQSDIEKLFGATDLENSGLSGDQVQQLIDGMKVSFTDLEAAETGRDGDAATVHITGKAKIEFDEATLRELVKAILEGQGQPADDATITLMLSSMQGALSQEQDLDEDVRLIQENGKWVICEETR